MDITAISDLVNGPADAVGGLLKTDLFFDLIEEGYDLVKVNGVWMLVDVDAEAARFF